jgi:hypothetical protein
LSTLAWARYHILRSRARAVAKPKPWTWLMCVQIDSLPPELRVGGLKAGYTYHW